MAHFEELASARHSKATGVRDGPRPGEWREGHITGSVDVPFREVEARVAEIPAGEVWLHCAGGLRASIVAVEFGLPLSSPPGESP